MTTRPELDVEGAWRLRSAAQLDGPSASYWSVWLHNNAPELLRRAREWDVAVGTLRCIADGDCAYGDSCPVGTRHGRCTPCVAREAIARIEKGDAGE